MKAATVRDGAVAFALIYFTFFLDNVLLTVLVPLIPDWVRGEALVLWSTQDAPLAAMLNSTVRHITDTVIEGGVGRSQAGVGVVLGAKAAAQLAVAPLAGSAVARRGPAPVLRAATAALALAAIVFASCGRVGVQGASAGVCAGVGRAVHGAGSAGAGVAGLALAAAATRPPHTDRAIGALLGAVALGVLVGYPWGGVANALWSRATPFALIAVAILINLGMQYVFLDNEEFCKPCCGGGGCAGGWRGAARAARVSPAGGCAGAVLLTTCAMAALEPTLPLWIIDNFHPQKWALGAVFVPDSVGYLVAASGVGGVARAVGAERVALTGQLVVGLAALAMPHATQVWALSPAQAALGCGLGAVDAALVPALLARSPPSDLPHTAALLHAAASAAYAIGPIAGGLVAWSAGFPTLLRALGVLNLVYAAGLALHLRRHPLSEQWGASTPEEDDESSEGCEGNELVPLNSAGEYAPLH